MIPYSIIIKKEQAIISSQKYFNFYDSLYYNNQKGAINKFALKNYFFYFYNKQAHSKVYDHTMYI